MTQAKKILAPGLSEAEAIERAKRGDAESFEALYGLHKRRVYSLCLRMTGNTAEAEDLTQESFLQAFARLQDFRLGARFHPWIYTIALNLCRSHLRRRSLSRWLWPARSDEPARPVPREPPARSPDPEQELLAREAELRLRSAIQGLPARYREVFVLRQAQGLSYEEIASVLGLPLGTVEVRLFRARRRLLQSLEAESLRPGRPKAK